MRARLASVFSGALSLGACACGHDLRIVDAGGGPVQGAQVFAQSPSMDVGPNLSDAMGQARVPGNIQGTIAIRAIKAGYEPAQVPVPTFWPLTITLMPERAKPSP